MAASRLREQLDAARQETNRWPAWKRKEIEAEIQKTPLRKPVKKENPVVGEDNHG